MLRYLSEDLLRNVIDTLPVRVFWKDVHGRIVGCNKRFAADVGCEDARELVGKTDAEFNDPEQARAFRADDVEVMTHRRPKLGIEEQLTVASGETRWLETNKLPLVNEAGEVIGILGTYTDITERVQMREERIRLIAELTQARDAALEGAATKSAFIAGMSHELRTPLNAIIGYAEMLKEDWTPDATVEKDLDSIVTAGRHLLAIVNDILDMSKLAAGRMVAEEDIVAPTAIVGEVIDLLAPGALKNGSKLAWKRPPESFMSICDAVKLRQCVVNLVSNACKFTKDGVVEVDLVRNDAAGEFAIAVSDTGIGISPETLGKLFQPFVQADSRIARSYGGTGLGLSITRSMAELMGGRVEAVSELGKGSTFTLTLPMRAVGGKGRSAERSAA